MYLLRALLLIVIIHRSNGVIYHLNETEFQRMPPVYKLDAFHSCLQQPDGVYCSTNFQLVSDEPSELLHLIEEYSEHWKKHFNHTELRHGICVTEKCQPYIQNKTTVSDLNLERCLNESFWKEYKLKTKVTRYSCYNSSSNDDKIEIGDILAGVTVLVIIMLNVAGSLFDVCCASKPVQDTHILLSFSIKRNWKRLVSHQKHLEPRLDRLKCLNGLKCIAAYVVLLAHCMIPYYMIVENTYDVELSYDNLSRFIIYNSPLLLQIFFVISGLLLAYKFELSSENTEIKWSLVPKGLLMRYLRLTPVYGLVILMMTTWFKFLGPGPNWEETGNKIILDCKERWWQSLFYLNNYGYNQQCVHTNWYLATDIQLFCIGLVVCLLIRKNKFKQRILITLTLIGIVIVAVHTYVRDLHSFCIVHPSVTRVLFASDATFNELYKTTHGNLSSYLIGLSLGYFVYECQRREIDIKRYSKLRYMYWSVVPLIFAVVFSGSLFYRDAPREPLYFRAIYAASCKLVIGILLAVLIAGIMLKLENVYRRILEWDAWTIPSRLTYCVYIIHTVYVIIYINMQSSLIRMSFLHLMSMSSCITLISYATAVPLYVLVEAPVMLLTKHFTEQRQRGANDDCQGKTNNMTTHL